MAVADFTTWAKVDPGSNLTLTGTNQINITTMSAASSGRTGYWYDGGAGWKSGDFRFRVGPVNISAASSSNSRFVVAGVTTTDTNGGDSGNENRPSIQVRWVNTTTNPTLSLDQFNSTASSSTAPTTTTSYQGSAIAIGTNFYLDIERSGSTCTCKIYSDSGYTTLVNTLSITLTEVISVRYAYAAGRYATGSGATVTAAILNFDTDVSTASSIPITMSGCIITGALISLN